MSFLNKFFKKQQKEVLEKQAEKQQKIAEGFGMKKKSAKDKKPVKVLPKKSGGKNSAKVQEKKLNSDAYKFLVKPLITEKISSMAADGKYGFVVAPEANKILIKKAVGAIYGVDVRE